MMSRAGQDWFELCPLKNCLLRGSRCSVEVLCYEMAYDLRLMVLTEARVVDSVKKLMERFAE